MSKGNDKTKRRTRRRKPCALDEALRREGLDEIGYARKLGGFFDQVEGNAKVPKLKLMLDGLKELSRHLEPKRPGVVDAEAEAPAVVQLVHSVDRPLRSDELRGACEARSPTDSGPAW
jgi:hypothetical protein